MKRVLFAVVCVAVLFAGCPVDTEESSYELGLSVSDQNVADGHRMTIEVNLGGKPPNSITYHGVRVVLVDNSTELKTLQYGNVTSDRFSVARNTTVSAFPDKVLIKYDKVTGADGPGTVNGYQWDDETGAYAPTRGYTPEY